MSKPLVCDDCNRWSIECRCVPESLWDRMALLPTWLQWLVMLVAELFFFGVIYIGSASTGHAQTFTADPATGISPVRVTLAWDIPGLPTTGTPCKASGSWSGDKAAKGTLTTQINASATYTLTCTKPGQGGSVTLNWVPPATNTDGTPLTDGVGYVLSYGLSTTALSRSVNVSGIATKSYTITDLPSGTWYFGAQTVNAQGVRSASSKLVSKAVTETPGEQTFAASVTVDVTRQPSSPTDVTVAFLPSGLSAPQVSAVRNLPQICADAASVGKQSCQVLPTRFDFPSASTVVKSDGTWLLFGSLAQTANVLVCAVEQLPGAIADPYRSLCLTDTYLPKSMVPLSAAR